MPKITAVSSDPPPRSGRPLIGFIPILLSGSLDEVADLEARDAVMAKAGFERVAFRLEPDHPDAGRRITGAACAGSGIIEKRAFGRFAPLLRCAKNLAPTAGLMGRADR